MSVIILKPTQDGDLYSEATAIFQRMYEKVTGTRLAVADADDQVSDLVVIGSDAVNDFVMNEMFEERICSLGIRYGTDDYCIRAYRQSGRRVLLLAGGRVRSTIYAIYDYFERYADCHYFWDGDVIPRIGHVPAANSDSLSRSDLIPAVDSNALSHPAHVSADDSSALSRADLTPAPNVDSLSLSGHVSVANSNALSRADLTPVADSSALSRADHSPLPMENISINESPRFEYRGLRYFAHRGLKRFQAEHWSLDDWKQEMDWMMKKRLNFFLIRVGMDDIWQKAFSEDVPYPDGYNIVTNGNDTGYDDRSDFWTLKYRGELRRNLYEYARKLDLLYPVDCGTMTHWYSRTPQAFLEAKKPHLLGQADRQYNSNDTGKVWDFREKENMDNYMHLTETMVEHYEKNDALFHTIGLGERRMFEDKHKNFNLKLFAYRRIAENIRRRYPTSKLLVASWDFIGWWSSAEVQNLMKELDPERTIILDYTSEVNDPNEGFQNWGVVGKFPWIFGLFHAYESESELRGPYDRSDKRLKVAADDPFCKGMILWPELSHSDPLILEYLSENAWAPLQKTIEEIAENFCRKRYGTQADHMNDCWQKLLPFIKQRDWGGYSHRPDSNEKAEKYCSAWHVHQDVWPQIASIVQHEAPNEQLKKHYTYKLADALRLSSDIAEALHQLADPEALKDAFILRDSADLARTVLGRFLNFLLMDALNHPADKPWIAALKTHYLELLDIMAELLCLNTDFSLYHTLKHLEAVTPTNPDFENTLKRNINNNYCRQACYELVTQVYREEAVFAFDWLENAALGERPDFSRETAAITERFMAMPLKNMQPKTTPEPAAVLKKAALTMEKLFDILKGR